MWSSCWILLFRKQMVGIGKKGGDDAVNSRRIFEIELKLYEEVVDYINRGSEPRDEEKEACYKAYAAVQDYRMFLQKKEKENASGGTST